MLPVSLLIWLILEIGGYLYFGRHVLGVDWAAASVGAVVQQLVENQPTKEGRERGLAALREAAKNIGSSSDE